MKDRSSLIGCLCAALCETIFGVSYVMIKKATAVASPFVFLGWRYLTAAAAMTLLVALGIIKVDLRGKDLKPLLLVALFNPALYFICETMGVSLTTASESGVFLACIPVASLAASALILKQKPAFRQTLGIIITLAGVAATVVAAGVSSTFSPAGYLFLAAAVISYALYAVFADKAGSFTAAEITYVMTVSGALVFAVLALAETFAGGHSIRYLAAPIKDTGFLAAILYQGIFASVLGFFLSNVAIAKIGVNRTASFIGLATVVSIIAGCLILGESFSGLQIAGAAAILCGVYVANSGRRDT